MRALVRKTAQFGEVVAAVFDKAAHYIADPKEVSRLATRAVALILRPRRQAFPSPSGTDWNQTGLVDQDEGAQVFGILASSPMDRARNSRGIARHCSGAPIVER